MMSEIYVYGDSTAQGIYLDENGSYRVSRRGCIRLLKKEGYTVSFGQFMRIGLPYTLTAVMVGYIYLWVFWR